MKTKKLVRSFFILLFVVSFAICLSNICDDDETQPQPLCLSTDLHVIEHIRAHALTCDGIALRQDESFSLNRPIILFLEMYEKSPPHPDLQATRFLTS